MGKVFNNEGRMRGEVLDARPWGATRYWSFHTLFTFYSFAYCYLLTFIATLLKLD